MIRYLITVCIFLLSTTVMAAEIVFRFSNPNFGGNPGMGTILMNQASEQNEFKAPPSAAKLAKTPIETFKDNLQRSILNRLSSSTTAGLFDESGNIRLGSDLNFDLNNDGQSDFSVNVGSTATNGNLSISITDGISNTTLVVPSVPKAVAP